jgi:hypothetical protein
MQQKNVPMRCEQALELDTNSYLLFSDYPTSTPYGAVHNGRNEVIMRLFLIYIECAFVSYLLYGAI